MRRTKLTITIFALLFSSVTASFPAAARPTAYASNVKVVGNNVVYTTGSAPVISNSCSPGISGYLFQSVLIIFGATSFSVTQSTTCP